MSAILNLRQLDNLVISFKSGDRGALDKIFYILRPLVEARSAKVVSQYGRNIDVNDLKQNLYLKLMRILKTWNPLKGASFSTYRHKSIESEVAQTIRDQLGYKTRIKELPKDFDVKDLHWEAPFEDIEEQTKKKELQQLLSKLLLKLGKKSAKAKLIIEAFTLHGAEDFKDVAQITRIPKSTIYDYIEYIKLALDESDKKMLATFNIKVA
jgi:RNA polymerase sigma factor (sigma-70 family)